jgi:hypothetical protein
LQVAILAAAEFGHQLIIREAELNGCAHYLDFIKI